ncbi:hypothetical protein C4J81_18525 [Deltaproteobacteria bacterium Smac51]|nr:hypothetical protein C4J81_18525 [Deltaproteobacteria bacterium Smac51]
MSPITILRLRAMIAIAALMSALIIYQSSILMAKGGQTPDIDINVGQPTGMCYRQSAMTEKELKLAIEAMRAIVNKKGNLSPEEEESLISSKGLTADRLNCLMGKLMAANDIFNWGSARAYGIPLTDKEQAFAAKYKKDSRMLKRYMEETLNITVE